MYLRTGEAASRFPGAAESHKAREMRMKTLQRVSDTVNKAVSYIGIAIFAVLIVACVLQVFFRFVLNNSLSWSEELARYLFVYDVMIGAAMAIRRNSHLQIYININLLKPKTRCVFTIVATVAGIVFMAFLFSYSLTLVQTGARTMSAGLGIPMSIPYACMPIGLVLMILTSIEVICKNIIALREPEKEAQA